MLKKLTLLFALALPESAFATQYIIPDNGNPASDCMAGYVCVDDGTSQTFSIGAMSFPPPFLKTATAAQLTSYGILPVMQTATPANQSCNMTLQMVSGVPTQTWTNCTALPGPSAAEQVQTAYTAALSSSIVVTCATGATICTSSITGSYTTPSVANAPAANQSAQANINAIETSIAAGRGLPGGGTSFNYYDVSGSAHAFNVAQWGEFATALMNYSYALQSAYIVAQTSGVFVAPSNAIQLQ